MFLESELYDSIYTISHILQSVSEKLLEFSWYFKGVFMNKFTIAVGSQLYTLSLWSVNSVTFVSARSTRQKFEFLPNFMTTIL